MFETNKTSQYGSYYIHIDFPKINFGIVNTRADVGLNKGNGLKDGKYYFKVGVHPMITDSNSTYSDNGNSYKALNFYKTENRQNTIEDRSLPSLFPKSDGSNLILGANWHAGNRLGSLTGVSGSESCFTSPITKPGDINYGNETFSNPTTWNNYQKYIGSVWPKDSQRSEI